MNNLFDRGRLIVSALAAVVMSFCLPAAAEEASSGSVVEEIVVTATYRDTNLMDTPMTISALTDVDIEARGVEDIKNLFLSIPGLNYGNATQTWHRVTARGVAQFSAPTGPVAMYVDNVPVTGTSSRQPLLPNFDLERIEVLKGPQGSLYGEGSMAGAIRYITKKPNPEGFDWAFTARVEDQSQSSDLGTRVDAMVNIPLGESLAVRVTPYMRNKPGLLDKYGPVIEKDVDFVDEQGVRAQLAYYPSDDLTINATYYFVKSDIGGPGIAFHCYVDPRPATANLAPGDFDPAVPHYPVIGGCESGPNGSFDGETARFKGGPDKVYVTHMASPGFKDGGKSRSTIMSIGLEWTTSFADLTISHAFYEHDITMSEEQRTGGRFGTLPGQLWRGRADTLCATAAIDCGTAATDAFWARSSVRAHSSLNERSATEVRLISNTDSRLQWTVGAYTNTVYMDADPKAWEPCGALGEHSATTYGGAAYTDVLCRYGGYTFNPVISLANQRLLHQGLSGTSVGNASYQKRQEDAFFGEVSYAITDEFSILAGIRYADSEFRTFSTTGWQPRSQGVQSVDTSKQEKSAPKVTLSWRPNDDTLVYATWSNAFRAGGVNSRLLTRRDQYKELAAQGVAGAAANAEAANEYLTFEGDDIESIEVGIKTTLMDGRIDLMLNWYDMQINNAVVSTSYNFPALSDLTTSTIVSVYPVTVNDNVGKALSRGVEIEMRGQLTDSISMHLGGAYVPSAETQTQQTGGLIAGVGRSVNIASGNRIRFTPVHSYFASLMYDFELAGYDATLRGDYYYRGKKVFRTENNERPTPTYGFLNLKLTLNRDAYQFGIYVKNVTDEIAPYSLGDSGYHGFHPPRSLGVQFSYRN